MSAHKITIDTGRCSGHGRCYTVAPNVFDCDDEGFPVLLQIVVGDGSPLDGEAHAALDACPERAISMVDEV